MACVEIKQKEARENFIVYSCFDYQNAAAALRNYCSVYFYNYGVYGWNCHLFPLTKGIALSIGYRPFGKSNKRINEMLEELDEAINEIDRDTLSSYLKFTEKTEKLVSKFIENVENYVIKEACNG